MGNKIVKVKKLTQMQIMELKKKAGWLRKKVLEMTVNAGAGHIAPSFSCIDILVALYYGDVLHVKPQNPKWLERDRFILSKGHAAVVLYAILADLGFFSKKELMTFTCDGSRLGGHTENTLPGVEAFTGSLGHGLSIAAGLALAAKMDRRKYITVALLGDGECHEGSTWEASLFAGHHCLNNLVAIIDHNRLSATDFLKNYLEIKPLKQKWQAFGWDVVVINGHSFKDLINVFNKFKTRLSNKPLAVIAITTKGKGVSFMENQPIWHYRIPVGEELKIALKELNKGRRK